MSPSRLLFVWPGLNRQALATRLRDTFLQGSDAKETASDLSCRRESGLFSRFVDRLDSN